MADPNKLRGANDSEKLADLCGRTYRAQAIWYLNAYWDNVQEHAEKFWSYVQECQKLDLQKGKEGTAVDEALAHRFLEILKETLTVVAMREELRRTGAIGANEKPKTVPLTHYLLFRYKGNWHELVNASQGDNSKEIAEAQKMLNEVQLAFDEAERTAKEAKSTLREAERSEAEAKSREAEAKRSEEEAKKREAEAKRTATESKTREEELRAAQAEVEAALAEVKAQEDARNAKTEELTRKTKEGGVVSQNKAKAELAQHLAEDPLPLRKAKITLEAASRKAEKATQAAAAARAAAEQAAAEATKARASAEQAAREAQAARQAAERARQAAEQAARQAEEALEEAQRKVAEAEAYLAEVKSRPGCAHGAIWWMERELFEAKKYLPTAKGGISRK